MSGEGGGRGGGEAEPAPRAGVLSLGLPPVLGISSSSWLARWEVTSREPGQELCCGSLCFGMAVSAGSPTLLGPVPSPCSQMSPGLAEVCAVQ